MPSLADEQIVALISTSKKQSS